MSIIIIITQFIKELSIKEVQQKITLIQLDKILEIDGI